MSRKTSRHSTNSDQLPGEFIARLRRIVPPDEFDRCLASFSLDKPTSFRVNTLKAEPDRVLAELNHDGIEADVVSWCPSAFTVAPENRRLLIDSPAVRDGRIYIQDLSSILAPLVLKPKSGEQILDLAAAPGGKTLQMAAMMRNGGWVSAVEPIRRRYFKLQENIRLSGATIVRTYLTDGRTVGNKTPERFDRVLLDAPCSGEARFRLSEPKSWAYWSQRKIREQARKQKGLLKSAIRAVRPGGVVMYCTCSFAPEENELVVADALQRFGDLIEPLQIEVPVNSQSGLNSWNQRRLPTGTEFGRRILPHVRISGFFMALLRKTCK